MPIKVRPSVATPYLEALWGRPHARQRLCHGHAPIRRVHVGGAGVVVEQGGHKVGADTSRHGPHNL